MIRFSPARKPIFFLIFCLPAWCFGQSSDWIRLSKGCLPSVAYTNHVTYKNGDRYVHPSFLYAGTGFLIDYNGKIFGVTAKHILWVAKNKKQNTVTINNDLARWVMKTKDGLLDSVEVEKLINEDDNEILEGNNSSILERDIIVFSIKQPSADTKYLTPRFSEPKPGEMVYLVGNPYHEAATIIHASKVVKKLGLDILIEQASDTQYSGFSGSPVIDATGQVIGVFSSVASDPETGKGVIVLTSMEYVKNVMERKADVNKPKEDYGALVLDATLKKNAKSGIAVYKKLISDPNNYYKYNLRSASRNGLRETGEKLVELNKLPDAIEILEFNIKANGSWFHNYNVLAKAYLKAGNKEKAIENFKTSTTKFDSKEENEAFKELAQLGAL